MIDNPWVFSGAISVVFVANIAYGCVCSTARRKRDQRLRKEFEAAINTRYEDAEHTGITEQ
jgi:hypothetical protein